MYKDFIIKIYQIGQKLFFCACLDTPALIEIANLALWFVPEGTQSAWTL